MNGLATLRVGRCSISIHSHVEKYYKTYFIVISEFSSRVIKFTSVVINCCS